MKVNFIFHVLLDLSSANEICRMGVKAYSDVQVDAYKLVCC